MSSDSNFGLTDEQIVYELSSALHSEILDILAYGIYTAVYFVALYLTVSRRSDRPRLGSAVIITVMWILVTIHSSITWVYIDTVYIQHGETREAQLKSLFTSEPELLPARLTDTTVTFISLLLADITMMWRCWVLYGRRWLFVIFPGSSIVTGSVCYIWRTILSHQQGPGWGTEQSNILELMYLLATVLTNIFCTTAIICRIVSASGWRKSLKTYRRLMEILIESSILYTSIYVFRIGLAIYTQYITEEVDERSLFAKSLSYSITGIAPTLIIARVAAGFARPDDSWTRTSLPHMGSTVRSMVESLHFALPAAGTVTDTLNLERNTRLGDDAERPDAMEHLFRSTSIQASSDENRNLMEG